MNKKICLYLKTNNNCKTKINNKAKQYPIDINYLNMNLSFYLLKKTIKKKEK